MNFTEIVANVLNKVKRPDKLADIQAAVNASLLFYSMEHDYDRDLVEQPITISPAGYTVEVLFTTLTRFRKVDYIKYAGSRRYVSKLESRVLLSECDLRDKWYVAGSSIKINLAREAAALDFSYYQYPPTLTNSSPEYWMLDGNWDAISKRAASVIFNDIGDGPSSTKALQDATLAAAVFRGDYVRSNQHT